MSDDAAGDMKARLRADLRAALKARDATDARVIRSLVAALDNAEAPALPPEPGLPGQHQFARRTAEVERLRLTRSDVHAVLLTEIQERERAAAEFDSRNRRDHAETLRNEARVIERYLT